MIVTRFQSEGYLESILLSRTNEDLSNRKWQPKWLFLVMSESSMINRRKDILHSSPWIMHNAPTLVPQHRLTQMRWKWARQIHSPTSPFCFRERGKESVAKQNLVKPVRQSRVMLDLGWKKQKTKDTTETKYSTAKSNDVSTTSQKLPDYIWWYVAEAATRTCEMAVGCWVPLLAFLSQK